MILSTHGFLASSIGQFDADYVAILNYATTQGYTKPSAAQQIKQNKLLVDLKAAGIWSKLDTFAVFATDGNSNFALIDWKRLSQYTAVNSPTFTTNQGFQGNGTSSYILTNFTPSTQNINYTDSDASFGVLWDKTSVSGGYLSAVRTTSDTFCNFLNSNITINSINSNSSSNRISFNQNYDFKQVQLNGGTQYLYGDGSQDNSATLIGSPSRPQYSVPLLGFRQTTAFSTFSSAKIRCFYAGASLLSESSNFNNALTTYYNSL